MSVQGMTGFKKVAHGQKPQMFQRCSIMIQRFQESYDAKANAIFFREYLILH